MFTDWDPEFDVICGAAIRDEETEPLADSGLWDLLHGRADMNEEDAPTDNAQSVQRFIHGYRL
jgi:hypothetical protein